MRIEPERNQDEAEIDLLALVRTLWRGKWLIMLAMFASAAIAIVYVRQFAVPRYTASAIVALESRQEQVVDLESVMSGIPTDQSSINTEIEVILSRHLLGKLVDQLDLTKEPEFNSTLRSINSFSLPAILRMLGVGNKPRDLSEIDVRNKAIDAALSRVSVSNVRQSKVFSITFTTESANLSTLAANTLANLYVNDQLDQKETATRSAIDFLTGRADELQTQLSVSENQLKDFSASTSLVDAETLNAKNRQIKDLRERLLSEQAQAEALAQRTELLKGVSAGTIGSLSSEQLADSVLATNIGRLQRGLLSNEEFDAILRSEAQRQELEAQRQADRVNALGSTITALEQEVSQQSSDLLAMQQLEREAEANRAIYEYFLGRLKETTVQLGVQQPDARLLSEAVRPSGPSFPRPLRTIALAIFMGSIFGGAAVLLHELRQSGLRSAEDLEGATSRTTFGSIPVNGVRKRSDLLPFLVGKPNSRYSEAIRNLRSSIELSKVDNPPKIILLTSTVPGEGKTTTSIALAHSYSGVNSRVLLIEADIRRRTFSEYFNTSNTRTLVDEVLNDSTVTSKISHNDELGIDVLYGGKASVNAADFFSSQKFREFIDRMLLTYDKIIIDTPPVLVVPDARIIGRYADCVLYVVHWDRTSRHQVRSGINSLSTVNVAVDGTVLSQIDGRKMRGYGYGESGGHYASYGSGYYDE